MVTGGLGFIGAHLCRELLAAGVKVLVIDSHLFGRRFEVLPPHKNLTVKDIDIRDATRLHRACENFRPEAIFHLAAIAFIPKCVEDPGLAVSVHCNGTINVLEIARRLKVHHLYFASSADVYSPEYVVLSERTTPLMPPVDVYGPTKHAGELLFSEFHKETKAHVVIARSFNVYGTHHTNRFLVPSICEQLKGGSGFLRLGNLSVARDYIHVEDVVCAILQLMSRTNGLVIVNVGSGIQTTVRELVALCGRIVARKILVVSDKKLQRSKTIDRPAWQADIRHIRKLVGWRPTRSLEDGLRELIIDEHK